VTAKHITEHTDVTGTATITSTPTAFVVVKAMQADGLDWGEGYRPLGRQALEEIMEDQLASRPVPRRHPS
jgi:hypothetical protein